MNEIEEKINKKLCILSNPKGGSDFLSFLFRTMGLDILDEKMGKDGTANWSYAVPDDYCFISSEKPRSCFNFYLFIHVVMDPFILVPTIYGQETIENMHNLNFECGYKYISTKFRYNHLNIDINSEDKLNRVVRAVLLWDDLIQKIPEKKITIKLEDCYKEIKEKLKFDPVIGPIIYKLKENPDYIKNYYSGTYSFNNESWKNISEENLNSLENYSLKYGYGSFKEKINM